MPTKTEPEVLTVTESFVGSVNGVDVFFREGDTVAPNHPAAKKWPHLFKVLRYRHEIEQATAAPGEKRA